MDDAKRMLINDAVPVNTRRPLLSGAWSINKMQHKVRNSEYQLKETKSGYRTNVLR